MNKRKLIRLLLSSSYAEKEFFDAKEELNLSGTPSKAKLLRGICALTNANLTNNSYMIFGVRDVDFSLVGIEYFDDAQLQDIVQEYLENTPPVSFENVSFPELGRGLFVGLLTIGLGQEVCRFRKRIWKIDVGDAFTRRGSQIVKLSQDELVNSESPKLEVIEIERAAGEKLEDLIDEAVRFYGSTDREYVPRHHVFHDQNVVFISGWPVTIEGKRFWSEVSIELLNEGISLFFSAVQIVSVTVGEDFIFVVEHIQLSDGEHFKYFPFEETRITFEANGRVSHEVRVVFEPPIISSRVIDKILCDYQELEQRLRTGTSVSDLDLGRLELFPSELLLCALNGSDLAQSYFDNYLLGKYDGCVAECYFEAKKILERFRSRPQPSGI